MQLILVSVTALLVLIVQTADGADNPTPAPTTLESVQKEIVDAINNCRRNVDPTATNMLEVEWNKSAQSTAQKYAETCAMKHSMPADRKFNKTDCGENLFLSSYLASWTEVINAFCNEKLNFKYGKGATKPGAVFGHYTQVAWYNSFMVGCGVAYCPNDPKFKYFFVCHQCPAGNIDTQITTPYESGPTCDKCKSNCKDKLCTNPCRQDPNVYSNCKDLKSYCDSDPEMAEKCESSCKCVNNEIV